MANSGIVCTLYPAAAAGTSLKASGMTTGAYKFAAAGANVKQIVAKNTLAINWTIAGFGLDTFSATSIFVIRLGNGAAAGAAVTQVLAEYKVNEITAAGVCNTTTIPYAAQVQNNGTTDALLADAASSNAGADDTVVIAVSVLTGFGSG